MPGGPLPAASPALATYMDGRRGPGNRIAPSPLKSIPGAAA